MIDFQPNPLFLTLIFVKRYVFLEAVTLLSVLRLLRGTGPARWLALVSVAVAGGLSLALVAPSLALGSWHLDAARAVQLGGIWPILAASIPLGVSAFLPGARWRWIDITHGLLIAGYAALWAATLV